MYSNLKAEAARLGITSKDMAKTLNIAPSTMSAKLNKTDRLKLAECKKIRDAHFAEMRIDFLFQCE